MGRRSRARLASLVKGAALIALLAVGGCAVGPSTTAPEVPTSLRPPSSQVVSLEALAAGVQIYECASKPDQPSLYQWTFRAPEAALVDRSGRTIGKHYAGPTWEADDGSMVKGEVKASDPGPTTSAISWLLLNAKSTTGTGIFSTTTSIQRVRTAGGIPPGDACTAANAGQMARIPYTATYYFYRTP